LKSNERCICSQKPEWCLRFGIVRFAKNTNLDQAQIGQYSRHLLDIGRAAGLARVGIAPATVMIRARATIQSRKISGLSDTMQFTFRNPERSTDPTLSVEGARSLVVGAYSYATPTSDAKSSSATQQLSARVARYAWADYYQQLRAALTEIADVLRDDGWRALVLADDNALVDRESAYLAGLGWYGKNSNLLIEGSGSFFVLGSVVTDAPLEANQITVADSCGACRRCLDSCPTGAIIEPGVIDARKCLAWLIQKPGVFDWDFRVALGDRIYGCDNCQEVCPPTSRSRSDEGNSQVEVTPLRSLMFLLNAGDAELLAAVKQWYIAKRNPMWVRRNALIILGNIGDNGDASVREVLFRYLAHDEPMLRAHAVWAAARLNLRELIPFNDQSPEVIAELSRLPDARVGI